MKTLDNVIKYKSTIKSNIISLENIDETLVDKLKNLEGKKIGECCDDCGCCCDMPCEPKCEKPLVPYNQFGRFNSEQEITRELDTHANAQTLYDIHSQFGRFNFVKDEKHINLDPLYFGYKEVIASTEPVHREMGDMPTTQVNLGDNYEEQLYEVPTKFNHKIYKAVNDIVEAFELTFPVVQTKINGEVQVYAIKHTGSNGKEGSIKSSLEEVAKILGKLDSRADIQWSQVLDVAIDNIDDVYSFVITFVFNQEKVRETRETKKLER